MKKPRPINDMLNPANATCQETYKPACIPKSCELIKEGKVIYKLTNVIIFIKFIIFNVNTYFGTFVLGNTLHDIVCSKLSQIIPLAWKPSWRALNNYE